MLIYAVILTIIIIIIYILISCRYYILAYLKYFKGEMKYKKDVNESLKVDLKTRKLSDETLKSGIKFLNEQLHKIGYTYKGEFKVPDDLRRELVYSKYSEKVLRKLFKLITEQMGITDEGVEFNIQNISSRRYQAYAGLYSEGDETTAKKISVFINSNYSYETVLAIFIHESTHYFLMSNGIKLKDRKKNEYITDIATVYMGFGKFMLEGYKQNKRLVYLSELQRTTSSHKVGYLNYSDVKFLMKQLNKNNVRSL